MKNEKLKTMWNKFKMKIKESDEVVVGGYLKELTTTLTLYYVGVFLSDEYNPVHWWLYCLYLLCFVVVLNLQLNIQKKMNKNNYDS